MPNGGNLPPEERPHLHPENTERLELPFRFSDIAIKLMHIEQLDDARRLWRALLDGKAGRKNRDEAMKRLQSLFWDMVDGGTLPGGRMVEELIAEQMPDYKKRMGLEDRPGLELDRVLPKSPVYEALDVYELLGSSERPGGR